MPRPRPPFLRREVTRHGAVVWYVRKGGGQRVRIRAAFGTPAFYAEYQAALSAAPRPVKGGSTAGSIAWLIGRYQETTAWTKLSKATQRQRQNMLAHIIKAAGNRSFTEITGASLEAARDRRSAAQGRKFLDVMRGLFRWAVRAGIAKIDPTVGIPTPAAKTTGFHVWSEDDVAAYEARWPIGTRQRVWFDVLLYTGLRRGDAVKLGRQHVRDGVATLKTEKTGTEVTLPILPVLADTLAAGPCGDLAFIAGESGRPLTKESFGNLFRKACCAAGLQNRSAHGLRKAPPLRSSKRSLVGVGERWQVCTRAVQIAAASRWKRCRSSRTKVAHLKPHLPARCGFQGKKNEGNQRRFSAMAVPARLELATFGFKKPPGPRSRHHHHRRHRDADHRRQRSACRRRRPAILAIARLC
jgi:integrase